MTWWLVATLVLAGLGLGLRRRQPALGQVLMGLGGLGLLGVIAWQVRQNVVPPGPQAPNRSAMAVGYGLANCLLGDLAGQDASVVLLFPQRRLLDAETEQGYEDGFTLPLRHRRAKLDLKVVRFEDRRRDPEHGLAAYQQALTQAEHASAIVAFAAVPPGFDTLFAASKPEAPPLYLFDPDGTTNWLGALKGGRVRAVVLPRPGVDTRARETLSGRPEAIFDRLYLLVTAANADQVDGTLSPQH
jgi:hypothetical protein